MLQLTHDGCMLLFDPVRLLLGQQELRHFNNNCIDFVVMSYESCSSEEGVIISNEDFTLPVYNDSIPRNCCFQMYLLVVVVVEVRGL